MNNEEIEKKDKDGEELETNEKEEADCEFIRVNYLSF